MRRRTSVRRRLGHNTSTSDYQKHTTVWFPKGGPTSSINTKLGRWQVRISSTSRSPSGHIKYRGSDWIYGVGGVLFPFDFERLWDRSRRWDPSREGFLDSAAVLRKREKRKKGVGDT